MADRAAAMAYARAGVARPAARASRKANAALAGEGEGDAANAATLDTAVADE